MRVSIHELKMPLIEDGARWAYGGDQDWCRTAWRRGCGCGPTTGANLCAYYASTRPSMRSLYRGSLAPFSKEEYIDEIEDIFRFITPSYMGFPYAGRFALKYRAYALYHGVKLTSCGCGAAESAQQMYDFVRLKGQTTNISSSKGTEMLPEIMLKVYSPEIILWL